jgi:hypothetical protein
VAGNLDTAFVNRLHDVSPMPDSGNPIDVATRVATIPQIHFSGSADTVVPPAVGQRFIAAAGGHCAETRSVANVAHEGDWARLWPMLLHDVPTCPEETTR